MKTLYVHIGQMKTGTTALQHFCEENRDVLNKHGYDFPIFPYHYTNVGPSRNGHFLIGTFQDEDHDRLPEEEQNVVDHCYEMIGESFETYDNVILTEEHLWNDFYFDTVTVLDGVAKRCETYGWNLKIVVYLRRQDLFMASMRNQQIKEGNRRRANKKRWKAWVTTAPDIIVDYYPHLEEIARVVGKENIIVRVYDRALLEKDGGSLYSDFLHAIGTEITDEYREPELGSNVSLTLNIQEIHRIATTADGYGLPFREIYKRTAVLCSTNSPSSKGYTMFSPAEARAYIEQFRESNDRIAREYLHRDGPLFDMTVKETKKWWFDNPDMAGDVVRYFNTLFMLQQDQPGHFACRNDRNELATYLPAPKLDVPELDQYVEDFRKNSLGNYYAFEQKIRDISRFFIVRQQALMDGRATHEQLDELTAYFIPIGRNYIQTARSNRDLHADIDELEERVSELKRTVKDQSKTIDKQEKKIQEQKDWIDRSFDMKVRKIARCIRHPSRIYRHFKRKKDDGQESGQAAEQSSTPADADVAGQDAPHDGE